ncbi:MAG: adenylate kinase family protein [Methanobacteriota archaeon]|nr:MAG: adenylate kinase family protein [Euryarchaeota archaeon]
MKVALTGTPGTGKSSAVPLIEGIRVVTVGRLVEESGLAPELDLATGALEIDTDALSRFVAGIEDNVLIEGHLSHLLGVDTAIVLRCSPKVLQKRLESRGYAAVKVRENMEAEAVDVILIEALGCAPTVCEIDTTHLSSAEVASAISAIMAGESEKYPVGHVDWSQEVLDWF